MRLSNMLGKHATDYYVFYFLTCLTLSPVAMSISRFITDGQLYVFNNIYFYFVGNIIILVAGSLNVSKKPMLFLRSVVIIIGLLFVVRSFHLDGLAAKNYKLLFTSGMFLIYSAWLGIVSFLNEGHAKYEKAVFVKYIVTKWLIASFALFVVIFFIRKDFGAKVEGILSKGSYFVDGGLNSMQIDILINAQKQHAIGFYSASILIFLVCFFVIYLRGLKLKR
jgi:hypothetical protein